MAVKKAILTAQHGLRTILLLELESKTNIHPHSDSSNKNIQVHKLCVIPAGRLAQWKGSQTWTT